ncbi:zinc finger protein 112-like [Dreissena polymorpha]|uniref:C2H2-type domain-containing protein n=1 Tax=Dreissena polymorpha TaxID=45954 RepID=A0A9D4R4E6_DREPO|nr:zinc finger protein 112-like [Dreissena polymorpha]XP_052276430.1 zinc finger protein 112-like [Dreissena polymorpha]KAH3853828.1 hypothetical protein DPMN_096363 [Dreissena polymorpha]
MPDQIGNISQTDSKYIGTFIGVLPILRPFKIHYRDPRKEEEGDELEVGVFMILPHENNIDESEVLDLTISMEDSRISTAEEMPSLMKNELEDASIKSENKDDLMEVKMEPSSDHENYDSDSTVNHTDSFKNLFNSNKEKFKKVAAKNGTKIRKSRTVTEASTSSDQKVEIASEDTDDYVSSGENWLNKFPAKIKFKKMRKAKKVAVNKTPKKPKRKKSEGDPQEKKKRRQWVNVKLNEHKDKYFIENFPSIEQRNRGSEIFETRYVCLMCNNYKSINSEEFEKHLELHLNGFLRCKKCNIETASHAMLNKHRQVCVANSDNLESDEYVCVLCGHITARRENYKHHMGTVHNQPQFKCKYCDELFQTYHYRRRHYEASHTLEIKFCKTCGQNYFKLTDEEYRAHTEVCSREVPCPECGKLYAGKINLSAHVRNTHRKVRRHQCHLCAYSAKDSQKLMQHIHAHQGVHPYKCEVCSFTCVQAYQLKSHMRTHTGEKPYKCDQCNYAAAWNVQLKDHMKVHGMETAVMCQYCGVLVKSHSVLSNHVKKEHQSDPSSSMHY